MTRPAIAIDRLVGGARVLRERGQMLALFTLTIFVLTGITALAVDVSWYWANTLKVQRAADSAALAGVVWLPGQPSSAYATARDQAEKNGYADTVGGVAITALKDGTNPRRLNVTISAPVGTFFMRVFGINSIQAVRSAKAEYVLPVPMGSPENYYGVFGKLRTSGGGDTVVTNHTATTANIAASSLANPQNWTNPTRAYTSNDFYATQASTINPYQGYDGFSFPALPGGSAIDALWVSVEGRADASGCQVGLELSSNANAGTPAWTTTGRQITLPSGTTPAADSIQLMPTVGNPSLWGRSWNVSDLATLGVRLRYLGGCSGGTVSVDQVQVSVSYDWDTSVWVPDANINDPYNNAISPRGFWGTMMTQGGQKLNGDAYLPQYDGGTSPNDEYDATNYYNYAIEMPAGSSNGEVWIYDPVFCATNGNGRYGTGDRYLGGSSPYPAAYAFYDLYDTKNTPYDLTDDLIGGPVASSGNDFKPQHALTDPSTDMKGPAVAGSMVDCTTISSFSGVDKGGYYHDRWYRLATGLAGGKTYRLHTTSEDPSNPAAMRGTDAHNSYALWSKATGGSPRIYGIGAMEVFTPLDPATPATFYLAQIDAVNAGKTMEIKLWDPGDTGKLSASLEILKPTSSGYSPATFTYSAEQIASGAAACGSRAGTTTALVTNTGNNSLFNGCWLTLDITLPNTYSAPTPPGEPGPGWWKIRYTMGNQDPAPAFDLTTWQVQIRGNPVHLIVP